MKIYLLSLAVGLVVGAFYALVGVRAPAPPIVALVGLLGIYCGEVSIRSARIWIGGASGVSEVTERMSGTTDLSPAAPGSPEDEGVTSRFVRHPTLHRT